MTTSITITHLLLQNPDKHCMETDIEQEVTLDPEALNNELAEEDPPSGI